MINELTFDEIDAVSGAGEVGDAIRAVGEAGRAVINNAYDAGYKLGSALRGLFT